MEIELQLVDVERSYGDDRLDVGAGNDDCYFYPDGGDDVILDFGNGADRIVPTVFEDIQSIADLDMYQQGGNLVINLSAQGGGTITLQGLNETALVDSHFQFFMDNAMVWRVNGDRSS